MTECILVSDLFDFQRKKTNNLLADGNIMKLFRNIMKKVILNMDFSQLSWYNFLPVEENWSAWKGTETR